MFNQMEADLHKTCKQERRMFAMHFDEKHIIVSNALPLTMSKLLVSKQPSLKGLYLLYNLEEYMYANT